MNLSPFVIARLRTFVPMAVGVGATFAERWLASHGIGISLDTTSATTFAVGLASGAYYEIVRRLERRWPQLGWLLGFPSQPTY